MRTAIRESDGHQAQAELTTTKAQLQKLFAEAPKRVIVIDSTQYVFIGADTAHLVDKKIKRALAAGQTVVEAGVSQWIDYDPIQEGEAEDFLDRIKWHTDGNRVRCEKILVTKDKAGDITKKVLGTAWRDATEVL